MKNYSKNQEMPNQEIKNKKKSDDHTPPEVPAVSEAVNQKKSRRHSEPRTDSTPTVSR